MMSPPGIDVERQGKKNCRLLEREPSYKRMALIHVFFFYPPRNSDSKALSPFIKILQNVWRRNFLPDMMPHYVLLSVTQLQPIHCLVLNKIKKLIQLWPHRLIFPSFICENNICVSSLFLLGNREVKEFQTDDKPLSVPCASPESQKDYLNRVTKFR